MFLVFQNWNAFVSIFYIENKDPNLNVSSLPLLESRLTVVNHEAKKKQHACASSGLCDHCSELFTRMAALKI